MCRASHFWREKIPEKLATCPTTTSSFFPTHTNIIIIICTSVVSLIITPEYSTCYIEYIIFHRHPVKLITFLDRSRCNKMAPTPRYQIPSQVFAFSFLMAPALIYGTHFFNTTVTVTVTVTSLCSLYHHHHQQHHHHPKHPETNSDPLQPNTTAEMHPPKRTSEKYCKSSTASRSRPHKPRDQTFRTFLWK
jgi:hypothetical protein